MTPTCSPVIHVNPKFANSQAMAWATVAHDCAEHVESWKAFGQSSDASWPRKTRRVNTSSNSICHKITLITPDDGNQGNKN